MIRLLLSLLALVSGLAASGVPAQARLCGGCETEINATAPARAALARVAPAPAFVAAAPLGIRAVRGAALRLPSGFGLPPEPARIASDRARE